MKPFIYKSFSEVFGGYQNDWNIFYQLKQFLQSVQMLLGRTLLKFSLKCRKMLEKEVFSGILRQIFSSRIRLLHVITAFHQNCMFGGIFFTKREQASKFYFAKNLGKQIYSIKRLQRVTSFYQSGGRLKRQH